MPALFPPTPSVGSLLVTPQPVSSFSDSRTNAAAFAYERPSSSLSDLGIVRKIVEREGCIEALQHLVSPPSAVDDDDRSLETDAGYCYIGARSVRASRRSLSATGGVSPMVAPLVLQSVLDQLRVVGVQVVEMILKWRRGSRDAQTFQWRGLNYLLKMTADLDFLARCATTVEPLRALRLERNPLLSTLHLDHPLLVREATRESVTPEVEAQLLRLLPDGNVLSVDRLRLFEASKVLAAELAAERRRQHLQRLSDQFGGGEDVEECVEEAASAEIPPASVAKSVHWSHRPVAYATLAASSSTPWRREAEDELVVARELLAQAEHELGALREQLAMLQRQLRDADEGFTPMLPPDRRRRLQTRIGGMVNDLKFRSADVFQRRNELRRREKASDRKVQLQQQQQQQRHPPQHEAVGVSTRPILASEAPIAGPLSLVGLDDAELLEETLQRDELRRHELVDRLARLRVNAIAVTRQRARSAPAARRPNRSAGRGNVSGALPGTLPMRLMTVDDVERFVDALGLGLVSTCIEPSTARLTFGALLKAQGIDGALLAAATDRDLEELGVALRLHRVRILDAVRAAA